MQHSQRAFMTIAASALALAFGIDEAHAEVVDTDLLHEWGLRIGEGCGSSGRSFGHCLADLLSDTAIEHAANLATRGGRDALGERFQISSRMTLEASGHLTGDLDAVIPLGPASVEMDGPGADSALFLQHGITSWRGGDGARRNDIRLGVAYRFPVSVSDVLGLSLLFQENLERDHQRLALGMDYSGRWGTGHASHFVPTTGWQPGRPGYEERTRGGTELRARMALTSTLSADAAMGRWDEDSGHALNARFGVDWRPHPWVGLGIGYETNYIGSGPIEDGPRLSVAFRIPLGRDGHGSSRPRWEGLGIAGIANGSLDLWAPITTVGRIATLERPVVKVVRSAAIKDATTSAEAVTHPDRVSAEFLQDDATSGSSIGVKGLHSGAALGRLAAGRAACARKRRRSGSVWRGLCRRTARRDDPSGRGERGCMVPASVQCGHAVGQKPVRRGLAAKLTMG